jgi:hypothetical protein
VIREVLGCGPPVATQKEKFTEYCGFEYSPRSDSSRAF